MSFDASVARLVAPKIVPVYSRLSFGSWAIQRAIRSGPGLGRIPPPTFQIVPVYSPGQTGETFSPSLFFSTTYANKRTRGGQIVPVAHGRAFHP